MKLLLQIVLSFTLLFFSSCSESAEEYIQSGENEKAIKIYKKMLTKDYNNIEIRKKIANAYFDLAEKQLSDNNLSGAKRNIDRGIIYAAEEDEATQIRYAEMLCSIGESYLSQGYTVDELDVEKMKLMKKGISLIEKSVKLGGENSKGVKILSKLNADKADSYFKKGVKKYELWQNNPSHYKLIHESRKFFNKAAELHYADKKNLKKQLEIIKKDLLTIAPGNEEYSFKILNMFANLDTRKIAFNIRFYNNKKEGYRAVGPKQFTLYDSSGKKYKPIEDTENLEGYKGFMLRRRLDAKRSVKGLMVFQLDKRITRFNKLVWMSSKGEIAVKEFPNRDIRKIAKDIGNQ